MVKTVYSTAISNIKKYGLLICSVMPALALFVPFSVSMMLAAFAGWAALSGALLLGWITPLQVSGKWEQAAAVLVAAILALMGFCSFWQTWVESKEFAALAGALTMDVPLLLSLLGSACCVSGFYAFYILASWITGVAKEMLLEKLPETDVSKMKVNLKRNWYFPVSAMAFFFLTACKKGMIVAFPAMLLISSQSPSIGAPFHKRPVGMKIYCIASTLGICLGNYQYLCGNIAKLSAPGWFLHTCAVVGSFCAAAAIPAVLIFLDYFWKKLWDSLKTSGVFQGITRIEIAAYGLLFAALVVFCALSFCSSEAFYGTEHNYDIIYSSDSPCLVKTNVYLALTHTENDLRQPLFAAFAAPFMGLPYLLGASEPVRAILMNSAQLLLLTAANFLLAKMMGLKPLERICFLLLTCCTYAQLLFTLMMEQYIVAYFWLMLCLYQISRQNRPDRITLWGTGGTLLIGLVLLPSLSERNPIREGKAWLREMIRCAFEFAAVLLALCRFDVIFGVTTSISNLRRFTGRSLTIAEKGYQFTAFVRNCFAAPEAQVSTAAGYPSWQMYWPEGVNTAGLVILALVLLSAIVNRKKKSSLLAAAWVAFSAVMLLVLGWGTRENGLILYALYFGWAYLVLLYQLVEAAGDRLRCRYLAPTAAVCGGAWLLWNNIPGILEMVRFAIDNYPA